MPSVTIGALTFPYTLERSSVATRAKITMTPNEMVVVVPEASTDEAIENVLRRKRRWIVETSHAMRGLAAAQHRVARFGNGAKIPYRGRMARLHLERGDDTLVQVTFRNGFRIKVPVGLSDEARDRDVETALRLWLKRKIRDDAKAMAAKLSLSLGVKPSGVHIKDLRHMWGSCGVDRSVNLNWQLVFAPIAVLEYAVLHEMCHLIERNHGPAFWSLIRRHMPDYERRKAWLERSEHLLGFVRLPIEAPKPERTD